MNRHEGLNWDQEHEMDGYFFNDCSHQSPEGRRSLCYDQEALEGRKKFPPDGSVMAMVAEMGIELLNEMEYRELQNLGAFDTSTSSWGKTPNDI